MKMISNVHTHTTFCDGKDSPMQTAAAALDLGFSSLGFSGHSPAPFDKTCSGIKNEKEYAAAVKHVKDEFKNRLSVLCGIEQDFYSNVNIDLYDYAIGSVHYILHNGKYYAIDGLGKEIIALANDKYENDWYSLTADYFSFCAENVKKNKPLIVGHFDKVKKHNELNGFFDENDKRYVQAAMNALDEILDVIKKYDGMIELNTGALNKKNSKQIYPDGLLLEHLRKRQAKMIITTDSHSAQGLTIGYNEGFAALKKAGFKEMYALVGKNFERINI